MGSNNPSQSQHNQIMGCSGTGLVCHHMGRNWRQLVVALPISLALRALRAPSIQSFGQVSTILDKKYPMWVMSIADFLELSQLPDDPAHLQLTTNGILAQQREASRRSDRGRWTKSFFPLAIFVSREFLHKLLFAPVVF